MNYLKSYIIKLLTDNLINRYKLNLIIWE